MWERQPRLTWQTKYADPDWIRPKWRTQSGVICPRCQTEIQALKGWHRIDARTFTGGPFVFCKCVRLGPSRLPSLPFFMENWPVVLDALNCLEQIAEQSESKRQQERHADEARIKPAVALPLFL